MKENTLPRGFSSSGIHCGAKKKRKDLALFYSSVPCKAAALFTTNAVKAAPVVLAEKQLKADGLVKAVVVNSGNANCMTGRRGMNDAKKMVSTMAKLMKVDDDFYEYCKRIKKLKKKPMVAITKDFLHAPVRKKKKLKRGMLDVDIL